MKRIIVGINVCRYLRETIDMSWDYTISHIE